MLNSIQSCEQLTKSSKLASEILSAVELVCLHITVLAGHSGHSRVSIGGIADRDASGNRIWIQSVKSAERIIAEFHRKHGMRRRGGLVVKAVPDDVDRLLRDSASLLGISVVDDQQIDAIKSSLMRRTDAAIAGMGRAATLKRLQGVTKRDLTGLLARL